MRRDTLRGYRRLVSKFDYHPSAERERQLIDSHLEALDRIEQLEAEVAQAATAPLHPMDYEGEDFV